MPHNKLLNCFIAKLLNWKKIYNNRTIQQFNNGFTLIELLIVISIIAILVATATASWQNAQAKGRDGKRKADLKAIQQAFELYIKTNEKYPASSANGEIQCNVTGDTKIITWAAEFNCDENGALDPPKVVYMQQLPKDPSYQTATDGYNYQNTGITTYVLSAKLENSNDPDLTGLLCTPASGRNYCVVNP